MSGPNWNITNASPVPWSAGSMLGMVRVCYGKMSVRKCRWCAAPFRWRQSCAHFIGGDAESHSRAFVQNPTHPLEHLLHSWKSFSSRNVNRLVGRSGTLWQRSYFDRLVRDEKHFRNCLRYIRRNPKKAHLKPGEYILYESDVAKQME